jgi:hypothetical protein
MVWLGYFGTFFWKIYMLGCLFGSCRVMSMSMVALRLFARVHTRISCLGEMCTVSTEGRL